MCESSHVRIFVTGGSGFIGTRLVRALLESGHEVVCMSRSGQTSAVLAELGAEVISGDLHDETSVRGCVREAEPTHIAHLAAGLARQRDASNHEELGVEGTRALLAACRDAPPRGFLYVSSLVRGNPRGKMLTEEDEITASTRYGKSKARAEELILEAHQRWQLPTTILRPAHVYGAGGWLAETVRDAGFRIAGKGDNYWDLVHVDDVVAACELVLGTCPAGGLFHVVDDHPVTMKQFFDAVAAAQNRPAYAHSPAWLQALLRGRAAVSAETRSARFSNTRLKSLGWTPIFPNSLEAVPAVVQEILGGSEAPVE